MPLYPIITSLFSFYTLLMAVRLIASWFPGSEHQAWLRPIAFIVDPYLNFFRRIIPPIGGRLDISPILAFLVLQAIEHMLVSFLC